MSLRDYGWDLFAARSSKHLTAELAGQQPGRVLFASRAEYRLMMESGERAATLAGRVRHQARGGGELPAVGDWVATSGAGAGKVRIDRVLPRKTTLSRVAAGTRREEQVVAANIDHVFVVMGLDGDFNLRRLERYLIVAEDSGATPAVLLTKCDLVQDPQSQLREATTVALAKPVLLVNGHDAASLAAIGAMIQARETAALIGSSGAGKSTIINGLLGRIAQETSQVQRGAGRGRHTTTHREMFLLPSGGLLIDNPGVREVSPAARAEDVELAFDDIAALALRCRFGDCAHTAEPGCAVREAAGSGALAPDRLASYRALVNEQRSLVARQDETGRQEKKRQSREVHRAMRKMERERNR